MNPNYGTSRLDLNSENEPFFLTISGNVVRTETPGMNAMENVNILKQGSFKQWFKISKRDEYSFELVDLSNVQSILSTFSIIYSKIQVCF